MNIKPDTLYRWVREERAAKTTNLFKNRQAEADKRNKIVVIISILLTAFLLFWIFASWFSRYGSIKICDSEIKINHVELTPQGILLGFQAIKTTIPIVINNIRYDVVSMKRDIIIDSEYADFSLESKYFSPIELGNSTKIEMNKNAKGNFTAYLNIKRSGEYHFYGDNNMFVLKHPSLPDTIEVSSIEFDVISKRIISYRTGIKDDKVIMPYEKSKDEEFRELMHILNK